MRIKLFHYIILLFFLSLFLFPTGCYANTVDTAGASNLQPQTQVAVDCFNYMMSNNYNKFFEILHPEIIKKTGGEEKIRESFNKMAAQLNGASVKLDIEGTKRLNGSNSNRYLVNFIMNMQDGRSSNVIVIALTPNGWKVIDI